VHAAREHIAASYTGLSGWRQGGCGSGADALLNLQTECPQLPSSPRYFPLSCGTVTSTVAVAVLPELSAAMMVMV